MKKAIPSAQLSGIYANKPGYHNCRAQLPSSDYSVQKSYDKKGDAWAAGALDITLQPADMKKLTQRLIDETKARGDTGKLRGAREFFGTVNGSAVTGMDVPGRYWITSDPSHLWHIHISGKREYANDSAAWADIASVLLGTSTPPPTPTEDDMPRQIYLTNKKGQTTTLAKAGTWYCVKWDADLGNTGGSGMSLFDSTTLFSTSVWLSITKLGLDENLYWRIQTLDRNNKELAKFPIGELRGTTGGTALAFGQVGSVSKKTNLRVLVASTQDNVVIENAWWRTLCW